MTADRDRIAEKLGRADLAVSACMAVNLENAQARDRAAERAVEAEKRVAEAANHADQQINSIMGELDRLRSRNLDCPAIDGRFRVWVRNN
jgi:sugar phosphate isomerase/epimerase